MYIFYMPYIYVYICILYLYTGGRFWTKQQVASVSMRMQIKSVAVAVLLYG